MHGREAIHWNKGNLHPQKESAFFLKQLFTVNCSSVRGGIETIYPIWARTVAGMIMCRSYAGKHNTVGS